MEGKNPLRHILKETETRNLVHHQEISNVVEIEIVRIRFFSVTQILNTFFIRIFFMLMSSHVIRKHTAIWKARDSRVTFNECYNFYDRKELGRHEVKIRDHAFATTRWSRVSLRRLKRDS